MTRLRPKEDFWEFEFRKQFWKSDLGLGGKFPAWAMPTGLSTGLSTWAQTKSTALSTCLSTGGGRGKLPGAPACLTWSCSWAGSGSFRDLMALI